MRDSDIKMFDALSDRSCKNADSIRRVMEILLCEKITGEITLNCYMGTISKVFTTRTEKI